MSETEKAGILELAALVHQQCCGSVLGTGQRVVCSRWGAADGKHRAYYERRAEAIWTQLEPEIGAANVALAVRVITKEIW